MRVSKLTSQALTTSSSYCETSCRLILAAHRRLILLTVALLVFALLILIFLFALSPLLLPALLQLGKFPLNQPLLHEQIGPKPKEHYLDNLVDEQVVEVSSKSGQFLFVFFLTWKEFSAVFERQE